MQDTRNAENNVTDNIDVKPWKVLGEFEGNHYVYKYFFTCSSYEVQVTDGLTLWKEFIDQEKLTQKCQTFNPNIEASSQEFLKYIQETFDKCIFNNSVLLKDINEKQIEVGFKSKLLESIPFSWVFTLQEESRCKYREQLVHPILVIAKELQRRQNELFKLLLEKDREIQDYKDHGAVVSRRYLETVPFDAKSFVKKKNVAEEFITSCRNDLDISVLCTAPIKDLYQNIQINRRSQESIEDDPHKEALPTSAISPTHIVNDDSTNEPEEIIKVVPTNEKEKEKERREALRKRLDEEAEKKQKKKKRKLKI